MPGSPRWSTRHTNCSSIYWMSDSSGSSTSPWCTPLRKAGRASLTPPSNGEMPDSADLAPLFATILRAHPGRPAMSRGAPLQAHVTNLDASPYLGRLALCRVVAGTMRRNQNVAWCRADGTIRTVKTLRAVDHQRACSGNPQSLPAPATSVAIAGIPEITIGETLAGSGRPATAAADHGRRAAPSR